VGSVVGQLESEEILGKLLALNLERAKEYPNVTFLLFSIL